MLKYVLLLALLATSASAASYSSVLAKYNVSSSVTGILVPVPLQFKGANYTLLYLHGNPYLLANDTNGTLVFSSNTAYAVAGNYLVSNALNSPYIHEAYVQMQNYETSSASSINDCVYETGLAGSTEVNTCTDANYCASCGTIPICKKALLKTGGPTGPFGQGIMQFEAQYSNLTSDYAAFYSSTEYINASNAQSSITSMNNAFSGIKAITEKIYQNPIFPPTPNLTVSSYSQCNIPNGIGLRSNLSSSSGPWYCNAVGFCAATTYNYSALNSISSLLSRIASLPISNAAVKTIAGNLSNTAYSYYKPILYKQKSVVYAHILNTTLFGYGKLVNNSLNLSVHISNSTFVGALSALQKSYANLTSDYVNLNLTVYNKTIASEMSSLTSQYKTVNATYSSIKKLSESNTQLILTYQLNSNSQPSQLSALAFSEYGINNQVSSKISNTKATYSQLQSINQSLHTMSVQAPLLPEITRAFDSGIVTSIEAGMSAPYAIKVASAPAYATLISLIICIVLLAILFVFYMSLNRKHHISAKPEARRNWRIIFAVAILLIIIDLAATYSSAMQASTFAPASSFVAAVNSAKTVLIINNGTSAGITNCSKQLSTALSSEGKTASVVSISSTGLCTVNGFVGNESACIDHAAVESNPAIVLSNGNSSSINTYSFYGSALFVSGSDSFLNQCIPAQLIG
jgi:hypothetical protein